MTSIKLKKHDTLNFLSGQKLLQIQKLPLLEDLGSSVTHQLRYVIYTFFHLQAYDLELNFALLVHRLFVVLRVLHKLEDYHLDTQSKSKLIFFI